MLSNPEENTAFQETEEVIKFFQTEINERLTPEQIGRIVNSLKPRPNPIYGQILDLLYVEADRNLAAVTIQSDVFSDIFVFTVDSGISSASNTIQVENLDSFKFRLQEAFNYDSSVIIKYDSNIITSLIITKPNLTLFAPVFLSGNSGVQSKGSRCNYPPFC